VVRLVRGRKVSRPGPPCKCMALHGCSHRGGGEGISWGRKLAPSGSRLSSSSRRESGSVSTGRRRLWLCSSGFPKSCRRPQEEGGFLELHRELLEEGWRHERGSMRADDTLARPQDDSSQKGHLGTVEAVRSTRSPTGVWRGGSARSAGTVRGWRQRRRGDSERERGRRRRFG
jgi:hypothetical protein